MDIFNLVSTEIFWGVEAWRFAVATFLIFLGLVSRSLIVHFFTRTIGRFAEQTEAQWDDDLVRLLPTPLSVGVQLLLWLVAIQFLNLPTEPMNLELYIRQGLQVAVGAAAIWFAFRVVDLICLALERFSDKTDSKLDDQLVPLARTTMKVIVTLAISVSIIQKLGYPVASIIASLGVGGLAFALAAKDTVANLFGSVVIFTDRPFQIGDAVEFAGIEGVVEEVGFRTTRIRRFDKSLVTVPNQTFSIEPIVNHSQRPVRRMDFVVGVSYETSASQMRTLLEAIRDIVETHDGIDQKFNFVHFSEFGDSALQIRVYCFTRSTVWTSFLEVQEDILLKIMECVERHGLEIAFPTQTLYLRRQPREQERLSPPPLPSGRSNRFN